MSLREPRPASRTSHHLIPPAPNKRSSIYTPGSETRTASATIPPVIGSPHTYSSLTVHELEQQLHDLRNELETAEILLAESQKDNEQKHEQNEQYKYYVKALEKLLDDVHGPTWRNEVNVPPAPHTATAVFSASTPLPKPAALSALRHSASLRLSSKRSSRVGQVHRVSGMDLGELRQIDQFKKIPDHDVTPGAAMRRLQGRQEMLIDSREQPEWVDGRATSTAARDSTERASSSTNNATPDATTNSANSSDKPKELSTSSRVSTLASDVLLSSQIERLTCLMSELPLSLAKQGATRQPQDPWTDGREKEIIFSKVQRKGILDTLEIFESRLDDRSKQMTELLKEARSDSDRWCALVSASK